MSNLKKILAAIAAALLLGALVVVVDRSLDPERSCLSWDGLREVRFGSEVAPACGSTNRLQRPLVSHRLAEWVTRLNRLNRLSWLADSPKSINLVIEDKQTSFVLAVSKLSIGSVVADRPGQLERAVLLAWLELHWPDQNLLVREIMADLLTWSVVGDATWSDPVKGEKVLTAHHLTFSLMPRSKRGYCQSPFRSVGDIATCDAGNMDVRLALRPLVSWTLWNYVRSLPASQQIHFFKNLVSAHFPGGDLAAGDDLQAWVRGEVADLLEHWIARSEINQRELRRQFFLRELINPVSFDLTVEVAEPELAERTIVSLQAWLKKGVHRHILFATGERRLVLPEAIAVDFAASDFQTQRYVMLACQWPKTKDVLGLRSRLFYAVQICGDQELPSWRAVMTSDAIHLRSLKSVSSEADSQQGIDKLPSSKNYPVKVHL